MQMKNGRSFVPNRLTIKVSHHPPLFYLEYFKTDLGALNRQIKGLLKIVESEGELDHEIHMDFFQKTSKTLEKRSWVSRSTIDDNA